PAPTLFPYTTLFRSHAVRLDEGLLPRHDDSPRVGRLDALDDAQRRRVDDADLLVGIHPRGEHEVLRREGGTVVPEDVGLEVPGRDRKSTRLNSSHVA